MNIFFLDRDPLACARYHGDKHVRKMLLEYAQLMCTAHHAAGNPLGLVGLYRPTHTGNRYALWTRESADHYNWLYACWSGLAGEYRHRWPENGKHKTWWQLHSLLGRHPTGLLLPWKDPPACDALAGVAGDRVAQYRWLYRGPKRNLAVWTNREAPLWLKE